MIVIKLKGGLGNQMFQYAFGKSLSLQLNTGLSLDPGFLSSQQAIPGITPRQFELSAFGISDPLDPGPQLFGLGSSFPYRFNKLVDPWLNKLKNQITVTDQNSNFNPIGKKTILLDGYFQKESYFLKNEAAIRKVFTFKEELLGENKRIQEEILNSQSASIHVRRGDYVTNQSTHNYHGLSSIEYYHQAIKTIQKSFPALRFFVFSDDPDWCRSNLGAYLPEKTVFISHNTGSNSYKDMQLMSLCRHQIIANSSFSWWGAWLNASTDKTVIAPKAWFANQSATTEGLYPKNWLIL